MTSAIFDFDVSGGKRDAVEDCHVGRSAFPARQRAGGADETQGSSTLLAPPSLWIIEKFWVFGSQLSSLGAPVWQPGHELKAEKDILWEQVSSRPTAKLIGAGHPTAQCLGKLSSSALVMDQWHPDQNLVAIRGCSFCREGCSLGAS